MKKGVHYWETFTATPREDTSRILCALVVMRNLKRRCGDIEKAYCWADLPKERWLACKYPDGLQRTNDKEEELYCVVVKNLYGGPPSGRNWGLLRDFTLLSIFNNAEKRAELVFMMNKEQVRLSDKALAIIESGRLDGWKCEQCEMDPCLFYFIVPNGDEAWAMIHSDDVDAVGETDETLDVIIKVINEVWRIKPCDVDYMLGVSRTIQRDDLGNVKSLELTMKPYIEGMAKAFEEHLPAGVINEPYPVKIAMSKEDADELEAKEVLDMGYQRAVGMIMWAIRHIFIEGKFGVSQICMFMSKPSRKAFRAAMHIIKYMALRSNRGIEFTADGNNIPFGMFDASDKSPAGDALCHDGFCIFWMGGPIMSWSKRLRHVGHSSEHNEYMAMAAAIKAIIWMRQLIDDMGLGDVIKMPTILFGDNVCANNLSREHFVSTGNQYIYRPYHFNREFFFVQIIFIE